MENKLEEKENFESGEKENTETSSQFPPIWFNDMRYKDLNKLDAKGWAQRIKQLKYLEDLPKTLFFDEKPNYPEALTDFSNEQNIEFVKEIISYEDIPKTFKSRDTYNYISLCFDLRIPTVTLLDKAANIIEGYKKKANKESLVPKRGKKPKKIANEVLTETHFASWVDHKIIQLMELQLWIRDNEVEVTKTELSKCLFPNYDRQLNKLTRAKKIWVKASASVLLLKAQNS